MNDKAARRRARKEYERARRSRLRARWRDRKLRELRCFWTWPFKHEWGNPESRDHRQLSQCIYCTKRRIR